MMRIRSILAVTTLTLFTMLAGCASTDAGSADADEANATSADDRQLTRLGAGGEFALGADGAYYVFDNALTRVDKAGKTEVLGVAPDKSSGVVLTDDFVVVEASPLSGDILTFYDRRNAFAAKTVPLQDHAVQILATTHDRVVVSGADHGVAIYGIDGAPKIVYTPEKHVIVRDMQHGKDAATIYGTIDRNGGGELIELDLESGAVRDVFSIPVGSFAFTYDPASDTFFAKRGLVSLPQGSQLIVFDQTGKVTATLDTPMSSYEDPIAGDDGFYLAARPGKNGGAGSWKLFAFDKKTLAMSDRGRVEPQVVKMVLDGTDLYYAHASDSTLPLNVRKL